MRWLWVPASAGTTGYYFFAAAARSTKVLPPFILCANGASLIWMTTASASTPRFFTSAWVISRIMPAFCSSVRPSAMLTVISGIFLSLGAGHRPLTGAIKQEVDVRDKPGHGDVSEWLAPAHVMARQHLAHFGDEVGLAARELRWAALAPFLVGSDRGCRLRALDQILDLHLATRFFIRALDDDAGRIAAIGIFELVAHVLGIAEIELGADAGGSQRCDHLLIVGDAVAVEHGDDDGAEPGLRVELAEQRQRGLKPRHADRETGRRHGLAAEARDQAIVASAAADRAEAHRSALVVPGLEQQFDLVDGAGVIFEAAHDRGVDLDAIRTVTRRRH